MDIAANYKDKNTSLPGAFIIVGRDRQKNNNKNKYILLFTELKNKNKQII